MNREAIYRQDVLDLAKKGVLISNGNYESVCKAINEIPSANPIEPSEDEYIKVPKKALKYRTAGMVAYNVEWLKNHFDIEQAVICGQQPCEDAISRQAVLDILKREGHKWGNDYRDWVDAIEEIKNLPSVNPTSNVSIQITEREKYGRFN